jgi:hypothetical protein
MMFDLRNDFKTRLNLPDDTSFSFKEIRLYEKIDWWTKKFKNGDETKAIDLKNLLDTKHEYDTSILLLKDLLNDYVNHGKYEEVSNVVTRMKILEHRWNCFNMIQI